LHNSVSQAAGVTVAVPARLHLGFLDLNGGLGRRFGGIGLAISDLKTEITIRKAAVTAICGPDRERVRDYLQTMRHLLELDGEYAVNIAATVPAHVGLGSGTQLALAVAAGVRRLHNLPVDVEADALRLGRGVRSGLGIGLFHYGGLIVDGGRGQDPKPAPVISHLSFPEEWRVLLVLDPNRRGIHGAEEVSAFAALAPMREADAADICRLMLMQALPAVVEHDLRSFGAAIGSLQVRLGDYFAPAQGGARFTSSDVAVVLGVLAAAGAHGIGQSSWGPTGFAFAASATDAERLADIARRHPNARGLDIRICKGLNHGAEIVASTHVSDL
jgi:beta-ribofuranosylaminobenzene 5'-phosphate synthase